MKSLMRRFDNFLQSIYSNSQLKDRIILFSLLLLVLPGGLLVALGIPAKAVVLVAVLLLLPLQFGIYHSLQKKEPSRAPWLQSSLASQMQEWRAVQYLLVTDVHLPPLEFQNAKWNEVLENLKTQNVTIVHIVGHGYPNTAPSLSFQEEAKTQISLTRTELLIQRAEMQRKSSSFGMVPVSRVPTIASA